MHLLQTSQITKQYNGRTIIQDISIHLDREELVSLIGVSGSGKTTLFQVISGLTAPEKGSVFLNGEEITSCPGKISYMFQKDLLLPHKRIIDNVTLPLILKGTKKEAAREKAAPLFPVFGLEGTQYQYPSQLSGGMRQRAALLRTYLSASEVALLDEPFSALDTITKSQMHHWYLDIMKKIKLSTILITHDIDEAIFLSDRIYLMTGNPGVIQAELRIQKKRDERQNFELTEEFLEYKRKITGFIRQGSLK